MKPKHIQYLINSKQSKTRLSFKNNIVETTKTNNCLNAAYV